MVAVGDVLEVKRLTVTAVGIFGGPSDKKIKIEPHQHTELMQYAQEPTGVEVWIKRRGRETRHTGKISPNHGHFFLMFAVDGRDVSAILRLPCGKMQLEISAVA